MTKGGAQGVGEGQGWEWVMQQQGHWYVRHARSPMQQIQMTELLQAHVAFLCKLEKKYLLWVNKAPYQG